MRRARLVLSLLGFGLVLGSWTAGMAAQSLAEAAAKEKARREALKKPGRTYTDKDLSKPEPPKADGQESPSPSEPPPAEPYQSQPSRQSSAQSDAEEARWRGQAKELRAAVTRADEAVKALESQANLAFTQSLIASDTTEIWRLQAELRETNEKIGVAKEDLAAAKRALADFEAEAAKAGIPSTWWSGTP